MTMTNDQAAGWIANVLKAVVENVSAHPQGGWNFEAKHVPAYGSSLIGENDGFDYCLLDTENDEEIGRHNETMMFTRTEADGRTLLVEGHYSRALGDHRDDADATFDGRMAIVGEAELPAMRASFGDSFSDRTLDYQLVDMGYTSSGLRTALFYRKGALSDDLRRRLANEVAAFNRAALELLEMADAA